MKTQSGIGRFIHRARVIDSGRVAFINRENAQWVAWTIKKSGKVYLAASESMDEIEERLEALGYAHRIQRPRRPDRAIVKAGRFVKWERAKRQEQRKEVEPRKMVEQRERRQS